MTKKKHKSGKVNWLLLIIIIILALLLIFSRGRRAARRVNIPSASTEQKFVPAPEDTIKTTEPITEFMQPEITTETLFGKVNPATDPSFVLIDERYASREGMYMLREAYDAFVEMHEAAREDGISLLVLSAMRTFDHQKRIWENKWNGRQALHGNITATDIPDPRQRALEILRFSAMPGTSRHHWGTDIDLNSLQNSYFQSVEGAQVFAWLRANAKRFGFCQPYTPHGKNRGGGYEEEKWHWSYRPVASEYLRAFKEKVTYDQITGFDGHKTAKPLQVIENYVLSVDADCK